MKTENEDRFGVALVKEACPLCGKLEDGPILMNTRLTKHNADEVKALNGKTIGYMDKPCKDCQEIMDQAILLIGIVKAKTTDFTNPYRSGNKWGVSVEFIKRVFQPKEMVDQILEKRACFFPIETAIQMGFPDVNVNA